MDGEELTQLNGYHFVDELVDWKRQFCYVQAKIYEVMAELAHLPIPDAPTGPDSPVERTVFPEEFAADEIRVALCWTRKYADQQLSTALRLVEDLPRVHAALKAGRIQPRIAEDISNGTAHVQPAEAVEVADKVLADVEKAAADSDGFGGLTTGQVRGRLRRLCAEVDPDAAKKRYKQGVENRRVFGELNDDGTTELVGCNLPTDRTARIQARIAGIADTLKRTGLADGRTMDQLRADTYLDLLESVDPLSGEATSSAAGGGGVEVVIPFDTLTGLADQPGELAGWGPVIADVARQVAQRQRNAQWRFSITDPDTGKLLDQVLTRRRPPAEMARFVRARDKTCRNPTCRAPANRCDLDHTIARSEGGQTHEAKPQPRMPPRPHRQTRSRLETRTTHTRHLHLDHRHRPQTHRSPARVLNGGSATASIQ